MEIDDIKKENREESYVETSFCESGIIDISGTEILEVKKEPEDSIVVNTLSPITVENTIESVDFEAEEYLYPEVSISVEEDERREVQKEDSTTESRKIKLNKKELASRNKESINGTKGTLGLRIRRKNKQRREAADGIEKKFICSLCSYATKFKHNLSSHELSHLKTKHLKCSTCSYATNFKSDLKRHILTHSETKSYKCSQCNYATNFTYHLKRHELCHAVTFICPECQFIANSEVELRRHLLFHSEARILTCMQCDYATHIKKNLRRHEKTHTAIKTIKCPECDYSTNFQASLKRHRLSHLDSKKFNCFKCEYGTNFKYRLRKHELNHMEPV